MNRILVINGSYRDGGVTDQIIAIMVEALRKAGAEIETVLLREQPIGFCLNCRACTQKSGDSPGACVQQDGMQAIITQIEAADGYILAAPTNFGSVTALFKRFLERLLVYTFWPWEMNAPRYRKTVSGRKRAVLISSCAAPGILGRYIFGSNRQLRMTAKILGAKSAGELSCGLCAKRPRPVLTERSQNTARKLAARLA